MQFIMYRTWTATSSSASSYDAAALRSFANKYSPNCRMQMADPGWWLELNEEFSTHRASDSEHAALDQPFEIWDPLSCQRTSIACKSTQWMRETCPSLSNGATNRQRQLSLVVSKVYSGIVGTHCRCLREMEGDISVLNTEAKGPVHEALKHLPNYESSEFFPEGKVSGEIINGVRHEDLQATSFPSNKFDIILTTEVFEHIPFPYQAFHETYRILKPGGAHVFTVPFVSTSNVDIVMSRMDHKGEIHHGPGSPPTFVSPMYHGDPIRPEGVLVFNLFGQEMVSKLCQMGFDVHVHSLHSPKHGVLGEGATAFIAWKM